VRNWAVVAAMLVGCGQDMGDCPQLMDCERAAGLISSEYTYGPEGSCWDGNRDERDSCVAFCETRLVTLGDTYPDVAQCQTGLPATGDTDVPLECGDTPPIVEGVELSDNGLSEGDDCGDEIVPVWLIEVEGSDDDGDLTTWQIDVYYDKKIDGEVDLTDDPATVNGTLDEDECDADGATFGMLLCVDGGAVDFDTEYELAVVLTDEKGNASEPLIVVGTSPAEP